MAEGVLSVIVVEDRHLLQVLYEEAEKFDLDPSTRNGSKDCEPSEECQLMTKSVFTTVLRKYSALLS